MLSDPVEGGGTVRDHSLQLEKDGRYIEELHFDPPPLEVRHLWFYWIDMSNMRGSTGFGPGPLNPSLIISWQQMRDIELLPIEIDLILAIENGYRLHVTKRMSK